MWYDFLRDDIKEYNICEIKLITSSKKSKSINYYIEVVVLGFELSEIHSFINNSDYIYYYDSLLQSIS